ncbi:MAG: DUF4870 domain-containing protein [Clostridia bacterium]|nr:DUF4870 domain-containing protein [Clostridia bacterium]
MAEEEKKVAEETEEKPVEQAEEKKAEEEKAEPKSDVEENKIFAVLAYIGILVLIPILAAPKSKFARYHSNQGLILLIVDIIAGVIGGLLGLIPYVGWVFGLILGVACLIFMILGIINAVNGEEKPLPVIGNLFTILK